MLRKKEKAGFNQATAELKKEIEKLQKASRRRPTTEGEQSSGGPEGAEEEQGGGGGAECRSAGRPEPSR